jgi:hypothetical protein
MTVQRAYGNREPDRAKWGEGAGTGDGCKNGTEKQCEVYRADLIVFPPLPAAEKQHYIGILQDWLNTVLVTQSTDQTKISIVDGNLD